MPLPKNYAGTTSSYLIPQNSMKWCNAGVTGTCRAKYAHDPNAPKTILEYITILANVSRL